MCMQNGQTFGPSVSLSFQSYGIPNKETLSTINLSYERCGQHVCNVDDLFHTKVCLVRGSLEKAISNLDHSIDQARRL